MTISLSDYIEFRCPTCRRAVAAQVWTVIDAEEWPDVWQQAREGRVNTAACPAGHPLVIGAPFLLHDGPGERVVYSPMEVHERMSAGDAIPLLRHVAAALPHRPDYLRQVQVVARHELPGALAAKPVRRPTAGVAPAGTRAAVAWYNEIFRGGHSGRRLIALCEEALRAIPREAHPEIWANISGQLGLSYLGAGDSARPDSADRAIAALTDALSFFTRQEHPFDWSGTMLNIGLAYAKRRSGDRDENLSRAAEHFRAALEVRTRAAHPEEWAFLNLHLGQALAALETGHRTSRLREAVAAFEAAQGVFGREQDASQWTELEVRRAAALRDLALALEDPAELRRAADAFATAAEAVEGPEHEEWRTHIRRELGVTCIDLGDMLACHGAESDQVIHAYEQALRWLTGDAIFADAAEAYERLGGAYRMREGDRAANLARAVEAYEAGVALGVGEVLPDVEARLHLGLGATRSEQARLGGGAPDEGAVAALERAAEWGERAGDVATCAAAHGRLAACLLDRTAGDPRRNASRGIVHCVAALAHVDRDARPEEWAVLQYHLGTLRLRLSDHDGGSGVEEAMPPLVAALSVFGREGLTDQRRQAEKNLVAALDRFARAEREPEAAIAAYESALEAIGAAEPGEAPQDPERALVLGRAHLTLGTLYLGRSAGDPAQNIELAVTSFRTAADLLPAELAPELHAGALRMLGVALRRRVLGERDRDDAQALDLAMRAAARLSREDAPADWAMAQVAVANAHLRSRTGDRVDAGNLAIAASRSALAVLDPETDPELWAGAQHTLGGAYARRAGVEPSPYLALAREAYERALTIRTRERMPYDWATTNSAIGSLLRASGGPEDQDKAAEALEAALEVFTPERHAREALAAAKVLTGLRAERSDWRRARVAVGIALAAGERLYVGSMTDEAKLAWLRDYASLYNYAAYASLRDDPDSPATALALAEEGRARVFREQLAGASLAAPDSVPPELLARERAFAARGRDIEEGIDQAPDRERRRALLAELASVRRELSALHDRLAGEFGAADYVAARRGEKIAWGDIQVWLRSDGRRAAVLFFLGVGGSFTAFLVRPGTDSPDVQASPVAGGVQRHAGAFFSEVRRFDRAHPEEETWKELGPILLGGVLPHLTTCDLLYVVPDGELNYLPIHALEIDGAPLASRFPVVYAPSVAVARRACLRHAGAPAGGQAGAPLVVGDPGGDLRYGRREAEVVARTFGVTPLLGEAATKSAILARLGDATHVHVAAHSYFDRSDPLASGIRLAGEEVLTAREILSHQMRARMVVLSGCESGASSVAGGSEMAGLTRAFLLAGARSVIASMWQVNDFATLSLMTSFYRGLGVGSAGPARGPADALRVAMLETRRPPHEHTFYWAPFALFGDPF